MLSSSTVVFNLRHYTQATHGHAVGSTALDIARALAEENSSSAVTFEVARRLCCSTCGMTSLGLSAATAGGDQHLKDCPPTAPARGTAQGRASAWTGCCGTAGSAPRRGGRGRLPEPKCNLGSFRMRIRQHPLAGSDNVPCD